MESYTNKYLCISLSHLVITYTLGIVVSWLLRYYLGIISAILGLASFLLSMRFRCTACYYYGKRCYSAFGVVAAKFFKKRQAEEFQNSKDVIITLTASIISTTFPIVIGLINTIDNFSGFNLSLLLIYLIVNFVPNFVIRPKMCASCRQGELGCPAYKNMQKQETT